MTWREYLWKEATDVTNVLLVVLFALTIWAVLWFTPTLMDNVSQWYRTYIACVEDAPSSKTLSDVIRSRHRCIRVTTLEESRKSPRPVLRKMTT